jgi:hypothetical protein
MGRSGADARELTAPSTTATAFIRSEASRYCGGRYLVLYRLEFRECWLGEREHARTSAHR